MGGGGGDGKGDATCAESRAMATMEGGALEVEALGCLGFVGDVRTIGICEEKAGDMMDRGEKKLGVFSAH